MGKPNAAGDFLLLMDSNDVIEGKMKKFCCKLALKRFSLLKFDK